MKVTSNRREYVESEFAKWNQEFIILFEQEFDVKAILDLEHQYLSTPDDHIKTKSDIVHTMQRLKTGLKLKQKNNTYMMSVYLHSSDGTDKVSTRVDVLDNNKGTLQTKYVDGVDYSNLAYKLIEVIKELKPTKVYFDKRGHGLSLFDVLKFDLKKHDVLITNNGELTYGE